MLDTTHISPDQNFELRFNATEFSMFSLAMTVLHSLMVKSPIEARQDMLEALRLAVRAGTSPLEIIVAINSLGQKIDLIAEHYKETPRG